MVSLALLGVSWLCLLVVGATLSVEYYDGYEYIMTGMTVAGEGTYFFPKNPVLSSILGAVYAVLDLVNLDTRSLAHYHLPILLLNLGLSLVIARWIGLFCPTLPIATIAALICFNRSFFHHASLALPDVLIVCSLGLWLYVDTTVSMRSQGGRLARMVLLILCALQRPQTLIIPAVSMVTAIIRDRGRVGAAVQIVLGSVGLYVALNTLFFYRGVNLSYEGGISGLGTKPDLIEALSGQFAFLRYYFIDLVLGAPERSSVWAYLRSILDALNPVGMGLFVLGAFQLRKICRSRQWPELAGLLAGSGLFLVFLLCVGTIGAGRYITPLLPALTLIQCFGLMWVVQKKKMLGSLVVIGVFAFSVIPEARHLFQPFYRADLEQRTAENIIQWSHSEPIYFTGSAVSPFFSTSNVLHEFHADFYRYRGMPAFIFFSRSRLRPVPRNPTFGTYGFPIPDGLEDLIEQDKTLIVPPIRIHEETLVPWESTRVPRGTQVTPLYTLRWSLERTPEKDCSPLVEDRCVEVRTPSPLTRF